MKFSKYFLLGITLVLFCAAFYSCTDDRKKACIEGMQNDGYSYENAIEACEDAAMDSQIR
jgi:formate hydrogenlyase subunit 3/multisubunit Na+/H+ antiporter MnhD subunit